MQSLGFPRIDPAMYGGVALEKCGALGKGFANRSAVMLDIGEYEKCLEDINLALEYGYPEELRPKLEARRLKCQEIQRQKVSNCSHRNFVNKNLESSILKECLTKMKFFQAQKPPVIKDPNPCIPACSSAVKVSYWPNKGRGFVATRDIKPGEVLGVERSFAVVVSQELLVTHCSTCTRPCVNPLPCPGCSQILEVVELYPAKSLINHSCSPVMSSKRFGRESFWYAVRPVAAGEELTISYVPDFSIQPKQERRGNLVPVYNIVCSCQACEESWPTLPHLPEIMCLCMNCKEPFSNVGMYCQECWGRLREELDIMKAFELRIMSDKVKSALDFLRRMANKLVQVEPISKQEFRHLCQMSEFIFKYSTFPSQALISFMKLMDICAEQELLW
ncbi:uncharacterized protein LOC135202956 isoform X2 [Macrobrachium nipponense]|uniref:uncharacterized protein LOC135202956 isoform X2 n=1 Tax=Macrobrachium nipponense TaxID=159736 RepID=UPI0030C822F0